MGVPTTNKKCQKCTFEATSNTHWKKPSMMVRFSFKCNQCYWSGGLRTKRGWKEYQNFAWMPSVSHTRTRLKLNLWIYLVRAFGSSAQCACGWQWLPLPASHYSSTRNSPLMSKLLLIITMMLRTKLIQMSNIREGCEKKICKSLVFLPNEGAGGLQRR